MGLRQVVWREWLTGVLIGAVLGLVSWPLLSGRWGQGNLAVGVALSLGAACATVTIAARALPWGCECCGIDPACGRSPRATVIQDVLAMVACARRCLPPQQARHTAIASHARRRLTYPSHSSSRARSQSGACPLRTHW